MPKGIRQKEKPDCYLLTFFENQQGTKAKSKKQKPEFQRSIFSFY
jgi:hypothetical protein